MCVCVRASCSRRLKRAHTSVRRPAVESEISESRPIECAAAVAAAAASSLNQHATAPKSLHTNIVLVAREEDASGCETCNHSRRSGALPVHNRVGTYTHTHKCMHARTLAHCECLLTRTRTRSYPAAYSPMCACVFASASAAAATTTTTMLLRSFASLELAKYIICVYVDLTLLNLASLRARARDHRSVV